MDLFLIDGNSYVYRAYYAIKGLTNSKGFPTNAIYGFTNMLLKIIREKKPDALVVAFDSPVLTERHRLFQDYKAHRPEAPSDLVQQLPFIRKVISAFRIKIFEMAGYEADDIIGTVAKDAAAQGWRIFIVTADKDMLQLVEEQIKIYDPMKDRILGVDYVKEKFGVGPERVTEFMALTGDVSDNIPGLRGVGEKTAKELLSVFESIEDLLNHPERIKKDRIRQIVSENKDIVRLSRKLATIDLSVPIEIDREEFALQTPDWLALLPLFKEFEFTTLMKLLPSTETAEKSYEVITSPEKLHEFLTGVRDEVAIDLEAAGRNPLTDGLIGVSVCREKDKAFYVPIGHSDLAGSSGQMGLGEMAKELSPVLQDQAVFKIGHNLKYELVMLSRNGIPVSGKLFDTMIAAYLLNPNKPNHSLEEVAFEYLSRMKKSFTEIMKKRKTFAEVPVEEAVSCAAECAALSYELKDILFRKLEEEGLLDIYNNIEMPLIPVLADMEMAGIKIDTALLNSLSEEVSAEVESIQQRVFFLAGEEFNINSPKQLSTVLFQSLGLTPTKKTKTGFSTGMEVLEDLCEFHELPREVLEYRSLTKLKSTYLDALPLLVNAKTGRLHTSFNQTVTATGRLSSTDPNLQNIPVRGDWGKRIRRAFITEPGNLLISADYSQVELRILAHLSGDDNLIDAFREEKDVHTRTAAELFSISPDQVTPEMRRTAKTVNFGVIYGISAFGLSESLNVSHKEAEKYIRQYFERHPGVSEYIKNILTEAKKNGFVTTLFGRKRPVPELHSRNRTIQQQGERLAVNSPIQGAAADIIKIAMIRICQNLRNRKLQAKMVLQVHDELLFEAPEPELDAVLEIVKEGMERAVELSVPLKVDIGYGKNWTEAH
jgi:DNA polymerase I